MVNDGFELTPENAWDILNNSPGMPIIDQFTHLSGLAASDEDPYPLRVNQSGGGFLPFVFRSFHIRYPETFQGYSYVLDNYILGVWNGKVPVAYFHCNVIQNGSIPPQYMNSDLPPEFLEDGPIRDLNHKLQFGSSIYAARVAASVQGHGIGTLGHTLMMAILQKKGYENFLVVDDRTISCARHRPITFRVVPPVFEDEESPFITSFYGWHTLEKDDRDCASYSTMLSTWQINLLRQSPL